MKIKHRHSAPQPEPGGDRLDAGYAAEVQRHTERGEREFAKAQKRLDAAESRRDEAARAAAMDAQNKRKKRHLVEAERLVGQRLSELADIHRQLRSSPASSIHRGRKSTPPPAPAPGELI